MWRQPAIWLLCSVLLPTSLQAADQAATFKERWPLELLPEKTPQIEKLLPGTAWVQHHPRNILGNGVGYAIRFPDAVGESRRPELHFTTKSYPSVNDRDAGIVETTHQLPLVVEGSILQYGGLVKTAFVDPGKSLVLDAAVRVGERKWYQLSSRVLDKADGRKKNVEFTEYLFEFEDDPLELAEGKLTVTRNRRKLAELKGEVLRMPATFTLEKRASSDPKQRKLKLSAELVERVRHNLPDLYFLGTSDFALLEGRDSPLGTGVFEAEKKTK